MRQRILSYRSVAVFLSAACVLAGLCHSSQLSAASTPANPATKPGNLPPTQPVSERLDGEPQAVAETRRAIQEEIDVDFEQTSLDAVLKHLSNIKKGLRFTVDPGVAAANIDLSKRLVNLKVKQVPLDEILKLALAPDLGYKVQAGVILVITTRERLLPEPVAYSVKDLARPPGSAANPAAIGQAVKRLIKKQSNPAVAAWDNEGGTATIRVDRDRLLITQTLTGHELIADVLQTARCAATPKADEVRVWNPRPPFESRQRQLLDYPLDMPRQAFALKRLAPQGVPLQGGFPPQLREVIVQTVSNKTDPAVASWTDEGGPGAVECIGDALFIVQSKAGSSRSYDLLEKLSSALATSPPKPSEAGQGAGQQPVSGPDEPPAVAQTRARLGEKIDLDLQNSTVEKALMRISELKRGLNIVVHPDAAAPLLAQPVTVKVQGATVAAALSQILGKDLGYKVEAGYILVTLRADAVRSSLSLAVYPVMHLVTPTGAKAPSAALAKKLVDAIVSTVTGKASPDVAAWQNEGGPASIQHYSGIIVVVQTSEGHHLVKEALAKWRPAQP